VKTVMIVLAVVSAIEAWFVWRLAARVNALSRLDDRLETLTRSIHLLTDTAESGFNTMAVQLETTRPSRSTGAARQRRVVRAAKTGRSVMEIAAQEEVAESEVRLRLHLAHEQKRVEEAVNGAMRS